MVRPTHTSGFIRLKPKWQRAHDLVLPALVKHHAQPVHLRPGVTQDLEQLRALLAVADDMDGDGLQPANWAVRSAMASTFTTLLMAPR